MFAASSNDVTQTHTLIATMSNRHKTGALQSRVATHVWDLAPCDTSYRHKGLRHCRKTGEKRTQKLKAATLGPWE